MSAPDKDDPASKKEPSAPEARLTGSFVLDLPKAYGAEAKRQNQQNGHWWAIKKPQFWIPILVNVATLAAVIWYAHEASLANRYTRNISEAVFEMTPSVQSDRGLLTANFVNKGKTTAREVHGIVQLEIKNVETDASVQIETSKFGERGSDIRPEGGFERTFALVTKNRDQALTDELAREVIILKSEIRYEAGFAGLAEWLFGSNEACQSFCKEIIADRRPGHGTSFLNADCGDAQPYILRRRAQIKSYEQSGQK